MLLRSLLSILLAFSLLLNGSGYLVLYACGMDGEVHTSCCCPSEGGEEQASTDRARQGTALLADDTCCDTELVQASPLGPPDTAHAPSWGPALSLTRAPPIALDLPCPRPRRLVAPSGPRAPPDRQRPPLYIEICSLLI